MKPLRSLLIDDELNARTRLRRLLEHEERILIVGEAKDGLEAAAEIERLQPDLIFLDIQMPGLDGFEMLQALPASLPKPLVIFVTGFHEHAMAAFNANAVAYLLKPIDVERLRETVKRAWQLHYSFDHTDPR
jgi:two-component system, LytTR family, response regulator